MSAHFPPPSHYVGVWRGLQEEATCKTSSGKQALTGIKRIISAGNMRDSELLQPHESSPPHLVLHPGHSDRHRVTQLRGEGDTVKFWNSALQQKPGAGEVSGDGHLKARPAWHRKQASRPWLPWGRQRRQPPAGKFLLTAGWGLTKKPHCSRKAIT